MALCIFLHVELDYNEAAFLGEVQTVYYDLHQIWVQGIIVPFGAIAGAIYASLIPIYNYVLYVPSAAFFGVIQVLSECGDPMVIVKSLAQAFVSISQLFQALATALGGPDGAWLSSRLQLETGLIDLQQKALQPLIEEVDCLCEFVAPTVRLLSNVVTSEHLSLAIGAVVNVFWRAWQVPAQLSTDRFNHHFNATPVFDEMRHACYHVGMVLDQGLETVSYTHLRAHETR